MAEGVARAQQDGGMDPAALEDELLLRPDDARAGREGPGRQRDADGAAEVTAHRGHELGVGDRVRGGEVDRSADLRVVDEVEGTQAQSGFAYGRI